MGSIDRRLEALERSLVGTPEADSEERRRLIEELEELERRREKMRAGLRRAEEKAAAEEAQGDTRRRHALDELYKSMKRRQKGTD